MTNGGQTAARSTLVITNLTKLAGVAMGMNEGFGSNPDSRVIALAALFAAGAQVSETVLLTLIERFFGLSGKKED